MERWRDVAAQQEEQLHGVQAQLQQLSSASQEQQESSQVGHGWAWVRVKGWRVKGWPGLAGLGWRA